MSNTDVRCEGNFWFSCFYFRFCFCLSTAIDWRLFNTLIRATIATDLFGFVYFIFSLFCTRTYIHFRHSLLITQYRILLLVIKISLRKPFANQTENCLKAAERCNGHGANALHCGDLSWQHVFSTPANTDKHMAIYIRTNTVVALRPSQLKIKRVMNYPSKQPPNHQEYQG